MSTHRAPLAIMLVAGLVGLGAGGSARPEATPSYEALQLYTEAMTLIHDRYVDELTWSKIVHDGIRGAVQGLDADSTVREAPAPGAKAPGDGDVGLVLARRGSGLVVVAARDGAPARAAGIQSGDVIVTIDGEAVTAMSTDAARERVRGRPGTQVTLTAVRSGWAEPRSFSLARAKTAPLAPSDRSLGAGVLYLRLPRLDDDAAAELTRLLAATPPDEATGLVLDLRDTVGGRIESVPALASLFLDPGCLLARVQSRTAGPGTLTTTATKTRWTHPVAVLVSHGTTGAAEVLAGALQDARRAVIVGSPTYGDASTRSAIPLSDGSTLELTTARYVTPGGHAITGRGIAPDVAAAERAAPAAGATAAADSGLELAFEVVKAAGILERGAAPPANAGLGRCLIPAA